MVSFWYPALDVGRYPRAPWMPEAAGTLFLNQLIPSLMMATGKRIRTHGPTTPWPVSLHGVRLPLA
jgi:hypothetical protein